MPRDGAEQMAKRASRALSPAAKNNGTLDGASAELVNLESYRSLAKRERDRLARLNRELEIRVDKLVADRLREQRITLRITQQELADRIGVAAQQVHRYERGDSRVTSGRLA